MKVLFLENVVNVGKKGEIKEVKSGYAANMLFPKKLAVQLTPEVERKYKADLKKDEKHRQELIENRHQIADQLNMKQFEFTVKTGNNHKVYGGIGEKDIIAAVKKQFKIELAKKHIDLPDGHLKKIGEHQVFIKLGADAIAKVEVILKEE